MDARREAPDTSDLREQMAGVVPLPLQRRLIERYEQPPRRYHTIDHAGRVAGYVRSLGGDRACLLAAWFHDAVYEPTATDNEERSAGLLLGWLGADRDAAEGARLVRLTAGHRAGAGDRSGAILCDADLAVLGSGPQAYEDYRAAVRDEYAHVGEAGWRRGRSAVLQDLLGREPLFQTTEGRRRWELPARQNLKTELRSLSS